MSTCYCRTGYASNPGTHNNQVRDLGRCHCPCHRRTGHTTRCADCGEYGETTGHMGCQYPKDRP